MDSIIYPQGRAVAIVPAAGSVSVFTQNQAKVYQQLGFPNEPDALSLIGTVIAGQTTFGPFAAGATIIIEAGAAQVNYDVGGAPSVLSYGDYRLQPVPVAVNVTGAVSAAAIAGGIVTSTTAAAVAGTVPTGTVMDQSGQFSINEAIDWSVVNTGPNAFTVTAAAGHTVVGAAAVATATSGRFRTVKTAALTFVTYRIS